MYGLAMNIYHNLYYKHHPLDATPRTAKGELIMSKYGRAVDFGGSPLEELGIWAAFQP